MTPNIAVDAVLKFFVDQQFSLGIDDSDWLLFQYGCYEWGDGARHFEFDLTRQFAISDNEVDESPESYEGGIWQLSLTLKFQPRPDLAALGSDHHWCYDSKPETIVDFAKLIRASLPYFILENTVPHQVELSLEDAE